MRAFIAPTIKEDTILIAIATAIAVIDDINQP
jgi:hypothetical protein